MGETIKITTYTLKELAAIYEMDHRTFKRHYIDPIAEELGLKKGRYYNIPQVEFIFKTYKLPRTISRDDVEK